MRGLDTKCYQNSLKDVYIYIVRCGVWRMYHSALLGLGVVRIRCVTVICWCKSGRTNSKAIV